MAYDEAVDYDQAVDYDEAVDDVQMRKDVRGNKFALMHMTKFITENCNRFLNEHGDVVYVLSLGYEFISARFRNGFNLNQFEGIQGHPRAGAGHFSSKFIEDLWYGRKHELNYRV